MTPTEMPADALRGTYRDVLRDAGGRTVLDSGWRSNTIAGDCHRLLAAFMRKDPGARGLLGLQVGAGADVWDEDGPPPATPAETELVDPNPFTLDQLQIEFLAGGAVSSTPTSRIQVRATLKPGVPPWPGAGHVTANLREFGLVAELDDEVVLVNYVRHMVIAKDPESTLERTIWLQF